MNYNPIQSGHFGIKLLILLALAFSNSHLIAQSLPLTNNLKDHPAPYLALHGNDPVAWQEWDQSVVDSATRENKIILLSIGYFACHWCHVMQRESYQDESIAELLNQGFIPVKIDRELEPALDRRLMNFAQQTTGRGGWPLNVFITPDGYPMYAVLYLPATDFSAVLQRLNALWSTDRENILNMVRMEAITQFPDASPEIDSKQTENLLSHAAVEIMKRADHQMGGFGGQTKFPSVPQLRYLLEQFVKNKDEKIQAFLELTLDKMAEQGLNDQLTGGFFRYTTDVNWAIPHFEKMLYDNAGLALLYLKASTAFNNPSYQQTALKTLDFMREKMWDEGGALVASFSAVDDENVEGGHYLWHADEVKQLLDDDMYQLVSAVWGLDRPAELAAGNHPRVHVSLDEYVNTANLNLDKATLRFEEAKAILAQYRQKRSLPVDDKLLAAWNGLALEAYSQAALMTGNKEYIETARSLANFLSKEIWDGEKMARAKIRGSLFGAASLEDYAYVTQGLLAWAEVEADESIYSLIEQLLSVAWQKFYQDNGWYQQDGTLLSPASGEEIIADGALPSASAVLIQSTLQLVLHKENAALEERARKALNRQYAALRQSPFWYVGQLSALNHAFK